MIGQNIKDSLTDKQKRLYDAASAAGNNRAGKGSADWGESIYILEFSKNIEAGRNFGNEIRTLNLNLEKLKEKRKLHKRVSDFLEESKAAYGLPSKNEQLSRSISLIMEKTFFRRPSVKERKILLESKAKLDSDQDFDEISQNLIRELKNLSDTDKKLTSEVSKLLKKMVKGTAVFDIPNNKA